MLNKLNIMSILLICVSLFGKTALSDLCNASDFESLSLCLSHASTEDLTIDLGGSSISLSGELFVSNEGFLLIIQNGSLLGNFSNFRILSVFEGSDLTLSNVTIEKGYANGLNNNGGGIFNQGNLHLRQTTLSHNKADNSGGSIYNASTGRLTIENSLIANGVALGNSEGSSGGGGIFNEGTIVLIVDSTISGNNTRGVGAGINNHGLIQQICGSTISYNLNCILVPGSGECENGQNPSGAGGGIYNDSLATIADLINSTIAQNIALQGGGIFNAGTLGSVTNSTIAYNTVNLGGGGIYNNTGATIEEFISNLVADNIDTNVIVSISPDILNHGIIVSENYNFIGNNAGIPTIIDGQNNDIVGADAHLLPLQDNGGPTYTIALDPRSRAINNGLNPYNQDFDQREDPFIRVAFGRPDIGAFEFQALDESPICETDDESNNQSPVIDAPSFIPMPPISVPVPVPVEVPIPAPTLIPAPTPSPVMPVAVPDIPVVSSIPPVPVSKPNSNEATIFDATPLTSDNEGSGCSTINHHSQSTHLMLILLVAFAALRNWRMRKAIFRGFFYRQ